MFRLVFSPGIGCLRALCHMETFGLCSNGLQSTTPIINLEWSLVERKRLRTDAGVQGSSWWDMCELSSHVALSGHLWRWEATQRRVWNSNELVQVGAILNPPLSSSTGRTHSTES